MSFYIYVLFWNWHLQGGNNIEMIVVANYLCLGGVVGCSSKIPTPTRSADLTIKYPSPVPFEHQNLYQDQWPIWPWHGHDQYLHPYECHLYIIISSIFSCHRPLLMTTICAITLRWILQFPFLSPWHGRICFWLAVCLGNSDSDMVKQPFLKFHNLYSLSGHSVPLLQNLEKVLDMSNLILTLKPGFVCSKARFCPSLLLKFQLLVPISFLYQL